MWWHLKTGVSMAWIQASHFLCTDLHHTDVACASLEPFRASFKMQRCTGEQCILHKPALVFWRVAAIPIP
ncbi:hypothetical protein DX877_06425 [Xylella fastidiosa subsp. fastidiosa]|nr:hypothetical protein XFLM_09845 [Xylella fastidiosa subsp. fastidiosa GB514]RUA37239.1 hypothetical protein DX877_06425 [Xylella fastidiosa subsp. fastidiosa]TNV93586.1 hypothetical protein C5H25_06195 [Xylella fastidiosa]TNW21030.1 hypothetical protein C5H12_05255 [Xylella fastidiosa]